MPSATFSADSNTFATANQASHSLRIWKLAGSGEKLVLNGHDGGVPCLAFSPDGKVLASASKDQLVKLWDAASGRLLHTLPRFPSPIQSIVFSPDGRLLATGEFGPTSKPVQIWDLAQIWGQPLGVRGQEPKDRPHAASGTPKPFALADDELGQSAYGVAFSPDGKFFAACGNGLTIWERSQRSVRDVGSSTFDLRSSDLEPGRTTEARSSKLEARTHDPSFRRVAHLPGYRSLCVSISSDSKLLAWVDHNDSLYLWDLANGRKIPYSGPPLVSSCWGGIALYPDSDHLTFPSATGMTETWDRRTMRKVFIWGKGEGVNVSPGGRWVIGPHPGQTLWSSQTRSPVFSLPQERGVIWSITLSPDGDRVAVGLADGGLTIWNVPKIQAQLAQIGLAWRADAQPAPQPAEGRNPAFR